MTQTYQRRSLYTDATVTIEPGRAHAIVGPNGSGKSVMMRLMCGFLRPTSGTVTIDPRFLYGRRTFPDRFGVVIDKPGMLPHLTGLENLRRLAEIRKQIGEERIREVMQSFGLDPDARQRVHQYSLGMKQKLNLCQAVMEDPDVLVLDEPFNALDADSVVALRERLHAFVQDGGTLVFTSHDSRDIEELADSIIRLENGRVTQEDQIRVT
ncbi:MAG: ABC transporter ATP-binding protein [Micrococcus sp.]|nr:ABC transporter ATP-binding protein [Micrococcus sp.]